MEVYLNNINLLSRCIGYLKPNIHNICLPGISAISALGRQKNSRVPINIKVYVKVIHRDVAECNLQGEKYDVFYPKRYDNML